MVMSALPLKADMCSATRDVRLGPMADFIFHSMNLVGALPFSSGLDHPPPKSLTLNAVPGLNPRIDPVQKRSDFFKSRAFEMLSSGGGGFFVRTCAVHNNLCLAWVTHYKRIDVPWMRR